MLLVMVYDIQNRKYRRIGYDDTNLNLNQKIQILAVPSWFQELFKS